MADKDYLTKGLFMLTHLGDSLSPVTRVAVLIMEQEVEDNLCHVHKRKATPCFFRHIGESKNAPLTSVDSQLPSAQNNPYTKVAYFSTSQYLHQTIRIQIPAHIIYYLCD